MAGRRRAVVFGERRGHAAVELVSRELDEAIRIMGLSYAAVGRDVGPSGAQVGRIAHGESRDLSIVLASTLLAAVGLDVSVRAFPTGRPLRDAPQLALLARFRSLIHPSLGWRSEVPVATGPDLRAWDAAIRGTDWQFGVEAETRVRDYQALERRVTLKLRDGALGGVILVVWKTRLNVPVVRSLGDAVNATFPVPGPLALERLAAGRHPGGSSLILL